MRTLPCPVSKKTPFKLCRVSSARWRTGLLDHLSSSAARSDELDFSARETRVVFRGCPTMLNSAAPLVISPGCSPRGGARRFLRQRANDVVELLVLQRDAPKVHFGRMRAGHPISRSNAEAAAARPLRLG